MSQSLVEKARELGRELAKTAEYQSVSAAKRTVDEHEAARIMYEDFSKRQAELEKQRMSGKPVSEDQVKALESAYRLMAMNPYVAALLMAEYNFAKLMNDVQKAMGAEVGIQVPDMPGVE